MRCLDIISPRRAIGISRARRADVRLLAAADEGRHVVAPPFSCASRHTMRPSGDEPLRLLSKTLSRRRLRCRRASSDADGGRRWLMNTPPPIYDSPFSRATRRRYLISLYLTRPGRRAGPSPRNFIMSLPSCSQAMPFGLVNAIATLGHGKSS